MADFAPDRVMIDATQRKRVKYEAKCAIIRYGFLPFSFSFLEEIKGDEVTLLKRIRMFFVAQDIGARHAVIEAAQRKRIKYDAKCANIGYGFDPHSLLLGNSRRMQ
ncbi:hypothetical protein Tco_0293597 [Tanacetum coccineum]